MKNIILFSLLLSVTVSCKNIPNLFETQKKESLPSNEKIISLLHKKISKDDFNLKIKSKKLLSQNKIIIERVYFSKDKDKTHFRETCQEIELKLAQTTKKRCYRPKFQQKLLIKCSTSRRKQKKCRKWKRPLFFVEYCEDHKKGRTAQEEVFLTRGETLSPLLKIQTCSSGDKGPLAIRYFKLISEKSDQFSQKTQKHPSWEKSSRKIL